MQKLKVGIIGCGNISNAYFKGAKLFRNLEIVACADINEAAAQAQAEEYAVEAMGVDKLLQAEHIEAVVNLTIPQAHAEVSIQALKAGKHVHCEKPLAVDLEEGKKVLEVAAEKGLRVGCAPDTLLGAGLQTARKALEDGWIGKPIAGTAFLMGRGPEHWHPNPAFFYQQGGGPMLDMGPYYMTALVHLLGPVKTVTAVTGRAFEERLATCENQFGQKLPVEIPTHQAGVLEFHSGAIVTVTISFDVYSHKHTPLEIYGTEGTLLAPDPNTFGGNVEVKRLREEDWKVMPYSHLYHENSRIIGLAEMADAIAENRPHRCSGELAYHVLEIMKSFEHSSIAGSRVELKSKCPQPAALPMQTVAGLL